MGGAVVNGSVVLENRGGDRGGRGGSSQQRFGECSHDHVLKGVGCHKKSRTKVKFIKSSRRRPVPSHEPETFDTT